jgi:hypothetical protein
MHRGGRILEMSDKVMLCRIIQDLGDTNDLHRSTGVLSTPCAIAESWLASVCEMLPSLPSVSAALNNCRFVIFVKS